MATPRRIRRANFSEPAVKPNPKLYIPAYPERRVLNADALNDTLSRRTSDKMSSIIDVYDKGFDARTETTQDDLLARRESVTSVDLHARYNRLLKDTGDDSQIPTASYQPMDAAESDRIRTLAAQYRASMIMPADFVPEKRVPEQDKAVKFAVETKKPVSTERADSGNYIPKRVVNPAPSQPAPAAVAATPAAESAKSPSSGKGSSAHTSPTVDNDDTAQLAPPRRQYFMPGAVPLLNDPETYVAEPDSVSALAVGDYAGSEWTTLDPPRGLTVELKKEGRMPPRRGDSLPPPPHPEDGSGGMRSLFNRVGLRKSESSDSSLHDEAATLSAKSAQTKHADSIDDNDPEAQRKKRRPKKGSRRRSLRRRMFGSVSMLSVSLIMILLLNVLIIDAIVVFVFVKIVPDVSGLQTKVDDTKAKVEDMIKKVVPTTIPTPDLKIPKIGI